MGSYGKSIDQQMARRNAALRQLQSSVSEVKDGVKSEVVKLEQALSLEGICEKHPWAVMGVALGAGVLASKLLTSHAHAPAAQNVVVEVRHTSGGGTTVTPVQPKSKSLIDYAMMGMTGFEAIRGMLQQFNTANASAPAEPELEEPIPINETV